MTIVAELSKRMQRQYDDLFVIKLAPPDQHQYQHQTVTTDAHGPASASSSAASLPAAGTSVSKKQRGRVALCVKRTPAMHLHGGLKELSSACGAMLQQLRPDTSDPDPVLHSPATDSRHTFLELCQFRHYQFDSLRRAKHSSLMLLYHLQNPLSKSCRPCCAHCQETIHALRWHCDACPDFDLCGSCYAQDQDLAKHHKETSHSHHLESVGSDSSEPAQVPGPPPAAVEPQVSPRRRSVSRSSSATLAHSCPVNESSSNNKTRRPHEHPLTPYRVSLF